MDQLIPVHSLGLEPAVFHLRVPSGWGETVVLYGFTGQVTQPLDGPLDLVKVTRLDQPSRQYELQLLHIEDEELDLSDFDADRDSESYLLLTPARLEALLNLLYHLGGSYVAKEEVAQYFVSLAHQDLLDLGFPSEFATMRHEDGTQGYRFRQEGAGDAIAEIPIVWLSRWSTTNAASTTMSLEIATYNAERLERIGHAFSMWRHPLPGEPPTLDLGLLDAPGALRLSLSGLSALTTLLEAHRFPRV